MEKMFCAKKVMKLLMKVAYMFIYFSKLFLFKVFLLITFDGTFTSFFIDKKSERSHKTVGIKVFLTIFA
jgi:hypothetical protein